MHLALSSLTLVTGIAFTAASSAQTAPGLPDLAAHLARGLASGGTVANDALVGGCTPDWAPTFGPAAGTDGIVYKGLVFDDGSGPALVVVGNFTAADGRAARYVARWDGAQWSPMGQGLAAPGIALAVHDDGSGPALYAGGGLIPATHAPSLARWDGVDWTQVPFPGSGEITALASYDDSTGPALYAGGNFDLMGSSQVRIVRYDGVVWSLMPGALIPALINDLTVHTEGGVSSLYLAFFGTAQVGGQPSHGTLRWSSSGWSTILGQPVGGGIRLAVHDDGGGAALYVGGRASAAANRVLARLVNGAWVEVAATVPGTLLGLASVDLGAGPRLHVAVDPSGPTGAPVVLELVGTTLTTLVTDQVDTELSVVGIVGFDRGAGAGAELALFGRFESANGVALNNVARVDGNVWRALGGNLDLQRPVKVAATFGSGAARRWVAVRERTDTSGVVRPFVDAWDGSGWTSLGAATGTTTPSVAMLQVLDDGSGERLYAGGSFTTIGGVPANGIAVHDGAAWSALGAGVAGRALCAALFDGGQGEVLVVGGDFSVAGGAVARGIATFDGGAWSELGGGLLGTARALAVDESAVTPTLYVAGTFGSAGNVSCRSIARWNGSTWSPLGPGLGQFVFNGDVQDVALFDEGQGPRLFVTGVFEVPNAQSFSGIARWDGTSWTTVGGASAQGAGNQRLLVHDDGTGPVLYLGATVSGPGGLELARGVARWDGATWGALPGEPFDGVMSLSVFNPGDGRALMCAGWFQHSPAGDAFVTRWRGCPAVVGGVYCAPAASNSTGVGATLTALGSTLVVEDDVLLSAADLPLNSFGVFLASRAQGFFPGYSGSTGRAVPRRHARRVLAARRGAEHGRRR